MVEKVTLIGTLPPLKSNAYYCWGLSEALSKKIKVDFIGFRKIYPEFLYKRKGGSTTDKDEGFKAEENENLKIREVLNYWNPVTWIMAGIRPKTRIVHSQFWSFPLFYVFAVIYAVLKLRRKKLVLTVHNVMPHEESFIDKLMAKSNFMFADLFLVHSEKNKEQLIQYFKIPAERIKKVHMGVHNQYRTEKMTKEEARKKLNLPLDKKILLLFGSLRDYKGIKEMIDALADACKKRGDVMLLFVGKPWQDWDKYERQIDRLGLRDKVKCVLDYIPNSEVQYYFYASDILCQPYKKFEAQSGVGSIGLDFGIPMIVSSVGGLPDLVKDKRAVVEPDNHKQLAEAILLMLKDEKLMKKLGQDSIDIGKSLSWDAAADRTIELYKEF